MHTCNALQARSCWLSVSACFVLVCAQEIADAQKGTKEAAANYTSPDATAEEQHTRCAEEAGELVDHFKRRMLTLLDWRNTSKLRNGRDADTSYEVNMSSPLTVVPEHSRGGFACVILDREYKIAYRLEPMQNAVDAAAWLAFHVVLEMFGVKAAKAVECDRPAQVFREDRGLSNPKPVSVWNQTSIVRCYQDPTLDAFSRHVVKQRNRMLRKVRDQPGLVGDVVVGAAEEGREASKIMTPRVWFWHKFYMRPVPEDENKTLSANDLVRRVRGRELADVLCHANTSDCLCGVPGGDLECCASMHGPQANQSGSMEQHPVRSVRLLCSVFELASGDLFSLARRRWRQGAPAGVVTRVMHDVGQALRCMHACGVAHGDLKMANVLKTGDSYKLADLPALTRATTKMLTSDPVVSTRITSGRRMLSNDMWGLGLVSITMLAGFSLSLSLSLARALSLSLARALSLSLARSRSFSLSLSLSLCVCARVRVHACMHACMYIKCGVKFLWFPTPSKTLSLPNLSLSLCIHACMYVYISNVVCHSSYIEPYREPSAGMHVCKV